MLVSALKVYPKHTARSFFSPVNYLKQDQTSRAPILLSLPLIDFIETMINPLLLHLKFITGKKEKTLIVNSTTLSVLFKFLLL